MPQDPKLTTLAKLVVLLFILGGLAAAFVSWRGGLDAVLGPLRGRPSGTPAPRRRPRPRRVGGCDLDLVLDLDVVLVLDRVEESSSTSTTTSTTTTTTTTTTTSAFRATARTCRGAACFLPSRTSSSSRCRWVMRVTDHRPRVTVSPGC